MPTHSCIMSSGITLPAAWCLVEAKQYVNPKKHDQGFVLYQEKRHPDLQLEGDVIRKEEDGSFIGRYLLDPQTKKLYYPDNAADVRLKCVEIIIFSPFYYGLKVLHDAVILVSRAVNNIVKGSVWEAVKEVGAALWDIVKGPF